MAEIRDGIVINVNGDGGQSRDIGLLTELTKIIVAQVLSSMTPNNGQPEGSSNGSQADNITIEDIKKLLSTLTSTSTKNSDRIVSFADFSRLKRDINKTIKENYEELTNLIKEIELKNPEVVSPTLEEIKKIVNDGLAGIINKVDSNNSATAKTLADLTKSIEKLTSQVEAISKALQNPAVVAPTPTGRTDPEGGKGAGGATNPEGGKGAEEEKGTDGKDPEEGKGTGGKDPVDPTGPKGGKGTGGATNPEGGKGTGGKGTGEGKGAVEGEDPIGPTGPGEEGDKPSNNKRKLKKVKLVRKAMDTSRILSEPKLPWYKRMFRFAHNHPVLTALIGGGIGLGAALLSGPILYMGMGLSQVLAYSSVTLGSGAVLGLGGGVLASAFSGRVLNGKKGRLYSKFIKNAAKGRRLIRKDMSFENQIDLSNDKAHEYQAKADNSKGLFKSAKRFVYRKLRNLDMAKANFLGVMRTKNQVKFNKTVDKALDAKINLNEREATPNRRGKTKTLAIAGHMQKKRNFDEKLARGKISQETYDMRVHDIDVDTNQPVSEDDGRHRTFDREAYSLINAVIGQKSNTMKTVQKSIEDRHSTWEEYEEYLIDQAQAKKNAEQLRKAGKEQEAAAIEAVAKAQAKKIEEYKAWARSKGISTDLVITEVEESTPANQEDMTK